MRATARGAGGLRGGHPVAPGHQLGCLRLRVLREAGEGRGGREERKGLTEATAADQQQAPVLSSYLLVHGAEVHGGGALAAVLPEAAAQDVQEGGPHVLVPQRVDDGVDEGVALGQNQAVLLVAQNLALVTAQAVQQQDHQAGRPAEDEAACPQGRGVGGKGHQN